MKISPADLLAEWRRSVAAWPFLGDVEATYRLPRCLLVAVGSRETNMTSERGDGGHGWGCWQLDDRSHTIPAGFLDDVRAQADTAAAMLRGLIDAFQGNVRAALDAYNAGAGAVRKALAAGRDPDSVTTGRDYGADVLERMSYLQTATNPAAPAPASPEESDVKFDIKLDPDSGGSWKVRLEDGAVYADDGAPYLGGLNSHQDWHAGADESEGHNQVQGVVPVKDGAGQWGYKIWTFDDRDGQLHGYLFPRDKSQAGQ